MPCDSTITVRNKRGERFEVPCGKCPPCKLRRVQGWVFRLQQEENRCLCAHFVTLSYDTNHVPITKNGFMTLRKSDVQNFFKRLRKMVPDVKVKYYLAGEYGTKRSRPHYHAIIFNVTDRNLYAKAWALEGKQFGTVHIGQVSGASIAYTLKYIDKPQTPRKHARDDRQREFSLMSKGLGENYVTDATKEYHNRSLENNFLTERGGKRIALPRFYRYKLFDESTLKSQTRHIVKVVTQQQQDEKEQYLRNNSGTTDDDYLATLDSARTERYRRYYHRQKERD